ncbi:MAG: efflux transporter outer membrane subunit [Candidatus Nitricoxidivorans perseverans]|uniref:Efflux transporter outer membrane subunit n=1 Tax=Candidatus Nitricoxidivorans perseverans TaxID=2975601 RepID=A0AA49ITY7_9PROT|nr:MAG: efflux transporter outer membrane subunit [Candidatus Nitricoxidivorans perseverans]
MHKTLLLLLALATGGCSLIPEYERPAAPVPEQWPGMEKGARQAARLDWRSFFQDPRLRALVEAALDQNRDMRIAVARVGEARALYGISRAERFPDVGLTAGRNVSHSPSDLSFGRPATSQRYDVALSVTSFELDFWGRVNSLSESAKAGSLATEEARRAFRLSLIADVAAGYFALMEMEERIALARATVTNRDETRALILLRREVGLTGDLETLMADGAYQTAAAELANLERQRAAAENALRLLAGSSPDLPAGRKLSEQNIIGEIPVGLPSEVLTRRPDVLAAEQRLTAANASIGAARAAFLPKIALTASLGTASKALSGLFEAGSGAWAFQPVLLYSIFPMGMAANEDLAVARKNIAIAEYEKTIQQAFREVADLLTARKALAEQLAAQEANEKTQAERLRLASARHEAGIAHYLEVLDAQRDLFSAQQNIVQTRRALLSSAVSLYKTAGAE